MIDYSNKCHKISPVPHMVGGLRLYRCSECTLIMTAKGLRILTKMENRLTSDKT